VEDKVGRKGSGEINKEVSSLGGRPGGREGGDQRRCGDEMDSLLYGVKSSLGTKGSPGPKKFSIGELLTLY
jgi:hypothetical protein